METLLKITTIPIEYELKIHRARLEYSSSKSELIANRIKGGLTIKKSPDQITTGYVRCT